MSEKEITRRKMCHFVMMQTWRLVRKGRLSLSSALRISWMLIRGKTRLHHTKVRGVSYDLRQRTICRLSNCKSYQFSLFTVRHYNNSYDDNAIGIYVHFNDGQVDQVGYLSKELAAAYSAQIDRGRQLIILDADVVGHGHKYYGLNFEYVLI